MSDYLFVTHGISPEISVQDFSSLQSEDDIDGWAFSWSGKMIEEFKWHGNDKK